MTQLTFFIFIAICVATLIAVIIALIYYFNSDVFKHPEEYKTKGATGERLAYLRLIDYGVPESQIIRNVYVPTKYGTTEIDIIVVSKKGVLVFECKNYHGTIYGDGKYDKWIQYLGKKKSYFYSHGFACYGYFISMESFKPFLSGFLLLAYFQGSFML